MILRVSFIGLCTTLLKMTRMILKIACCVCYRVGIHYEEREDKSNHTGLGNLVSEMAKAYGWQMGRKVAYIP